MKNQNIPHINELTDSELTDIILINEQNDGFEIDDELINDTEQLTREEKIDLVSSLGNFGDTRHCGIVKPDGTWDVYNGNVRFKDKDGSDLFFKYWDS